MEKEWLEHRESLEQLFTTNDVLWERLKFNFKQGYVKGYTSAHKRCADGAYMSGYDDGFQAGKYADVQHEPDHAK